MFLINYYFKSDVLYSNIFYRKSLPLKHFLMYHCIFYVPVSTSVYILQYLPLCTYSDCALIVIDTRLAIRSALLSEHIFQVRSWDIVKQPSNVGSVPVYSFKCMTHKRRRQLQNGKF